MGRRNQSRNSLPNGKRFWKIALYIRLSKEDGNDVSNSVINQQDRLLSYLDNFENEYELEGTYIDDGYSGTDTNRESFQRMCKNIREHKINCVIVKDLSRLSRNVTDATYHIETFFIEYDIRFISLELPALDSYKNPDQMNSILVPIQNVINDDFCRQTSIKIRGVFNQKRRKGQFIGAFAPYGYLKNPNDKNSFVIDEDAAPIVRDIFQWYVKAGMSKNGITHKLNNLKIPNPAAYKKLKGFKYENPNTKNNDTLWCVKTVSEILLNQMYLGHMVQGKYRVKSYKVHTQISTPKDEWFIVENTHEPIVDKEIFEQAQKLQEKDTRTPPNKNKVHLLAGYVKCADCKKAMVRSQGGSKVKTTYYQCRTYREKSKEACSIHSIRAEILEKTVLNAIQVQIKLVYSLQNIINIIKQSPNTCNESQRIIKAKKLHEKELSKIIIIKDSLYEDWKVGNISKDDYFRMKNKYEEQEKNIKNSIAALKEEQRIMAEGINDENPYLQAFLKYRNIETLDRSVVVDLVEIIYIHENGEVEIVFNFQDQHKIIKEFIENNIQKQI